MPTVNDYRLWQLESGFMLTGNGKLLVHGQLTLIQSMMDTGGIFFV